MTDHERVEAIRHRLSESDELPVKKKVRLSYDSQLTADQRTALQRFFQKNRYPSHSEKKQLSEQYNLDPFFLNKWFHGERTRYNKEKGVAPKKRKKITAKGPKAPKATKDVVV